MSLLYLKINKSVENNVLQSPNDNVFINITNWPSWLQQGGFTLECVGFLAIADGFIQFNCRHKKHLILPDFLQLFSSSDGIQLIFRWYNFSFFKCYTIKPFLDGKEILLHIIFFQCKFLPPIGTGCDLMAVKTFVRFLNTF